MGVRAWARRAIDEGGPVRWGLGLALALVVELLLAAAFALLWVLAVVAVAPPALQRALFGSATLPAVWLSGTLALFLWYTRGTFAAGGDRS